MPQSSWSLVVTQHQLLPLLMGLRGRLLTCSFCLPDFCPAPYKWGVTLSSSTPHLPWGS